MSDMQHFGPGNLGTAQITEHPVPDRKETKLTFAFQLLWEQQTTYNTRNIYS